MGQQGTPLIVASLILGICILGAAWMIQGAVSDAGAEVNGVRVALGDLRELRKLVQADLQEEDPAPAAARPSGPDPGKRHSVNIAGAPTLGNANAKVTLIEFSDFQCPYCARVNPTLERLRADYGDDLRIVFKHMPLSFHTKAPAAHMAATAAGLQGKFWEMHDLIFANQAQMSDAKYLEWAGQLGLDVDKFQKDLKSPEVRGALDRDLKEASALGVNSTPSFFINGLFMSGAKPYAEFKRLVDAEISG